MNQNGITDENFYKIIKEVKYLKKLKNDYIVECITSWMESHKCICIQMEFCEYDLQKIINMKNTFDPSLNAINYYISCELFREILECVEYLHSYKPDPIIHRDLKPENILISLKSNIFGRFVKLCDFGIAVDHKIQTYSQTQRSLTHTAIGTPGYMAPEVLGGLRYNSKADVYSIGMISQHLFNEFDE